MLDSRAVARLASHLFSDSYARAFAVLDGASVAGLDLSFAMFEQEYSCLFPGELSPDMAEVAPYLVVLEERAPFTQWVVSHGWGNHWGIFGTARADLSALRRHLRKLVLACDEEGRAMYFRYYDPRVLQMYLPTCDEEELRNFFGPVVSYLVEDESQSSCRKFILVNGVLREDSILLRSRLGLAERVVVPHSTEQSPLPGHSHPFSPLAENSMRDEGRGSR